MTTQFLLTFPATAPAAFLAEVAERLRYRGATRLQDNVWLLPFQMELADGILARAEELGVTWTLHLVGGDLVPMAGRMQNKNFPKRELQE